jgi:hypothetical protein
MVSSPTSQKRDVGHPELWEFGFTGFYFPDWWGSGSRDFYWGNLDEVSD